MGRWTLIAIAAAGVAGCDSGLPHEFAGARGALDDGDYYCAIYPADGYASIQLGTEYWLDVSLPPAPDTWGRGTASLSYGEGLSCRFGLGAVGVRVQYGGEPVRDPGCDACSSRYHALYVEGMAFPGGSACDCTGTCRDFGATHADRWYVWCDAPDEFTP